MRSKLLVLPMLLCVTPALAAGAAPAPASPPSPVATEETVLLEAADAGKTGTAQFAGTVAWSVEQDATGAPVLVARGTIPDRKLTFDLKISRNADPAMPAAQLVEVNFQVPKDFAGLAIGQLPGMMAKDDKLVMGKPLTGASAQVVPNSFLIGLTPDSATDSDNFERLMNSKWLDLALVYTDGKRAVVTIEKDGDAQLLFDTVKQAWTAAAAAAPPAAPASVPAKP